MTRYFVKSSEVKQSQSGKIYKKATIVGDDGEHQVSVWGDFMGYEDVQEGKTVEGIVAVNGAYKNLKSEVRMKGAGRGNFDVAAAQARKSDSIEKAQDNKDYSIKVASTFSSATLITIELLKDDKLSDWHTVWQQVRTRLWDMWDVEKPEGPVY